MTKFVCGFEGYILVDQVRVKFVWHLYRQFLWNSSRYGTTYRYWHMYYRKPQQIVLISSLVTTCFGRVVHIQALT